MLDKKCPEGTPNCIKEGEGHLTCHIINIHEDTSITKEEYKELNSIAVKYDQDKPDLSHITYELVDLVARVRMFGAKKYERNGWKKGFKYCRSTAAALRHIFAFLNGEDLDPESGLSHIGHAIASLEHLVYDIKHHPENDDRYKK